MISGFMMLSAFHFKRYADDAEIKEGLIRDVHSALELELCSAQPLGADGKKTIDLYDDGVSIVTIDKRTWGLYEIIHATSNRNFFSFSKTALTGEQMPPDEKTALFLADHNNYLSLCGKTKIKGTCYLPALGPRRAYIEGQSFIGNKLVDGEIKTAQNNLPPLNKKIIDDNTAYMNGNVNNKDSLRLFSDFLRKDSIICSFNERTLILFAQEDIHIDNKIISGNIILRCNGNVTLLPHARIDNILIYGQSICVKKGFNGNAQLFAQDSLIIEEDCKLNFPSAVVLFDKKKDSKKSFIRIDKDSEIFGLVLLYKETSTQNSRAVLKIETDALVHGQVYCNDLMEHKGTIHGSLFCEKFILSTPSSVYENHLLNATIDVSELSPYYTGSSIMNEHKSKNIIKWLN
ncbi:MAG: hypothetical protein A2275_05840 [Bacteroidetes bacterium RIFOXYA12_FULL_35_11]|nr:MAG: hypothetical protein A2X01_00240 [Bacteroidetes bacterium GWF2_35_48]OFY78872.1 MAG: hypothetical protein A2275_05840 [Bacteroidetes bacterium RIFOXYA12_FULL_35_11]OFZ01409.1 MAG: hypothetical protein A2491_19660 [Bacteroidetes bacterium RIFOXYC12_FULL_35_7]